MPIQQGTPTSFLNPKVVVEEFDLKPDMHVADFGSGAGHFALAMAERVGKRGTVAALDVRPEVLEVLNGHRKLRGLLNITTRVADLDIVGASQLGDNSQDRVLCANILHQTDDAKAVVQEAFRVLKRGGSLIIIDWKPQVILGPRAVLSAENARALAEEAGFVFKNTFDAGAFHYGFILTKHT
ncbi:MAG: methyltransferase domain-containing protein [Candidatus Spechtbacterales bacterium]